MSDIPNAIKRLAEVDAILNTENETVETVDTAMLTLTAALPELVRVMEAAYGVIPKGAIPTDIEYPALSLALQKAADAINSADNAGYVRGGP